MRHRVSLVLCGLALSCSGAALDIKTDVFDFGSVSYGEIVSRDIPFMVRRSCVIENITSSCGCVVPSIHSGKADVLNTQESRRGISGEIGERLTLRLVLDTNTVQSEAINVSVAIFIRGEPPLIIRTVGRILRVLQLASSTIDLGVSPVDSDSNRGEVAIASQVPCRLRLIRDNLPKNLVVDVLSRSQDAQGESWIVTAQVMRGGSVGLLHWHVPLVVEPIGEATASSALSLVVVANRRSIVRCTPSNVICAPTDGEIVEQTVRLEPLRLGDRLSGATAEVDKVDNIAMKSVVVDVASTENALSVRINIRPPAAPVNQVYSAVVRIRVGLKYQEFENIYVHGQCKLTN